jgi:signal peptidase I
VGQPLVWLIVIAVMLRLPAYSAAGKQRNRSSLIKLALILGFVQIIFFVIGGLFSGFGKSPSSFTPSGIFINLILFGTSLFGMELARAWLVNHLGKRAFFSLAICTIFFTMLELSFSQIKGLGADLSTINTLNETILPALSENLLASLIALLAGPYASMAYRGVIQAFWWFCPILPDLSWSMKGLIGVIFPILGLILVWNLFIEQSHVARVRRKSEGIQSGWIITAIICVAIVWFAVGIFPAHPVLIASGSMRPEMEVGDVAVIAKVPDNKLQVGDVIEFRKSETMNVVHRIVDIQEQGGKRVFITKGDANSEPDSEPVLAANVIGKVVFQVPKIGWIGVGVKSFFIQEQT